MRASERTSAVYICTCIYTHITARWWVKNPGGTSGSRGVFVFFAVLKMLTLVLRLGGLLQWRHFCVMRPHTADYNNLSLLIILDPLV